MNFLRIIPTSFNLTLLALPKSIALGLLAAAPFGLEWSALGVLSGIIAYIIFNFIHPLFKGMDLMNSGPYSLSSITMASIATLIIYTAADSAQTSDLVILWFISMMISALFQMMFGLLKLGYIAKYMPYPVLSGLINGAVLWIVISQLPALLGLSSNQNLSEFNLEQLNPVNSVILIGLVALYGALNYSKLKPQREFIVLVIGLIAFNWSLISARSDLSTGLETTQAIFQFDPILIQLKASLINVSWWEHKEILLELLPQIFGLSLILSLRTLLSVLLIDELQDKRSNVSQELIAQGASNFIAAIFGGINSSGSQARIMMLHQSLTDHTHLNQISSVLMLMLLVMFGDYLSLLPLPLLALILLLTAIKGFDGWSLQLFSDVKNSIQKEQNSKQLMAQLFVVVSVTVVMLTTDVFVALAYGLTLSILIVIFQMSKSVIRRQYSLKNVRANIQRPLEEIKSLETMGEHAMVFELEGALFFGTADRLAEKIDRMLAHSIRFICFDLNRIVEIDASGYKVLKRINNQCLKKNIDFMLSIKKDSKLQSYFKDQQSKQIKIFDELDDSLVWIEDELLKDEALEHHYSLESFFSNLNNDEFDHLKPYWETLVYQQNDFVFHQGDEQASVYFIKKGRVDVSISDKNLNSNLRITTLCSGTVFGEMSLFDNQPRSADIIVNSVDGIECQILTLENYNRLMSQNPDIALKVMQRMSREVSERVRSLNLMIGVLK